MARLRIDLQYDGTDFKGWQIQPNDVSVQETLEWALTQLNSNKHFPIVGCGRTDTGVHAMHYVAHCDWTFTDLTNLSFKLNAMLPESIKILDIKQVHDEFHARFDAKFRTYRYFIDKEKSPFNNRFAYHFKHKLDLDKMNQAAELLIGQQDFKSFAKHHSDVKNHICNLTEAFWTETNDQYIFQITANRFLRNMVRSVVGTLIEVGLKKIQPKDILKILNQKDRSAAGSSVPGKGLFLWKIEY